MNVVLTTRQSNATAPVPSGALNYCWRLIDQAEVEMSPKTAPIALSGESEITVVVPGALNTLAGQDVRALRVVEFFFSTPSGVSKAQVMYLVEAESTLVVSLNTFQTYGEAVLGAYDLLMLPGWSSATKEDRSAALIAARRNIAQLRFRYVFDAYQNIVENTVGVSDLTLVTKSKWDALPDDFKMALKRAQIYEADFLLTGGENAVDAKRRLGIISETVGESSMFMRSVKALDTAVSRRAMRELAKFVLNRVRTTRS